jgi:glycosyltransferase involved in cell wall biosynthesis
VKVPNYGDSHNKKRILKWLNFSASLFRLPLIKMSKPDVVLVSPMATFPVYPAYRLAKKFKAKFVFEVKDIWPLSLMEIGGYKATHPFICLLRFFERFAWKNADHIVSNLPNYAQHIKDSGFHREVSYIPNGIDLDELSKAQELHASIVDQIPENKFVVGYVGTVGAANALNHFVDAANVLRDNREVLFVIVGDGQEKPALIKQAKMLENILFIPSIAKPQVQSMLALFNICYIGLKKEKLFEYGVSPNKIFDYMYSGKPILHSISTSKDLVQMAKCGVSIEAEDPQAIVEAVLKFKTMSPEQRIQLGQNGHDYSIKKHDYAKLAKNLEKILL